MKAGKFWVRGLVVAMTTLVIVFCMAAYVRVEQRLKQRQLEQLRAQVKAALEKANGNAPEKIPTVASVPLWIIARDSQFVASAVAEGSIQKVRPNETDVLLSFKLINILKGYSLVNAQDSETVIKAEGSHESCPVSASEAANYPPGASVIILFNKADKGRKPSAVIGKATCLVVQNTNENWGAVEKGISQVDRHFR